jgi:tetratricopeptide (TPR) repeat protein
MAQVYLTRGDLDRALGLYQESLALDEQIGDLKGKAASLSMMANIHMARGAWEEAERCLVESLDIARRMGDPVTAAFNTVKLGQVAAHRGDLDAARRLYGEGLAVFERLGMPEAAQVRAMLADLDGAPQGGAGEDPLRRHLAAARSAAGRGDAAAAVASQEAAVGLMRARGDDREALVSLSVLLYNLAGYYGQAARHADAVRALEEVVALDERTGHPDLESDRQALEAARRRAAGEVEPGAGQAPPVAEQAISLEDLPPEIREQVAAFARQLEQMAPEEREALAVAARRQQIEENAGRARDAAVNTLRDGRDPAGLIAQLEEAAAHFADGEAPGSPYDDLAVYLRAVAAVLRGEAPSPIPSAYAGHLAAVQAAR